MTLSEKNMQILNSKKGLSALLKEATPNPTKAIRLVKYEKRLAKLQEELLILQQWVVAKEKKVVILFEGRDAAGKSGAIRRITEHLPPRAIRIVALPKPDDTEKGQWYFQRYITHLPNKGEIVFFDRSWYNRAVVEPVNDFCTEIEYYRFLNQVNEFENMIQQSGVIIIKLYFSITKDEQKSRFTEIINSPVKKWKYSPVDKKALELWDEYTKYKKIMFNSTQEFVSWKIIKGNKKIRARIEAIEHILKVIPYELKDIELIKHKSIHNLNEN